MQDDLYSTVFQALMAVTNDGFIIVDPDGIILDINQKYCDFLGKHREDVIGKPIKEEISNTKMYEILKAGAKGDTANGVHIHRYIEADTNDNRDMNMLYNEPPQGYIIIRTIEEPVMIQPIQEPEGLLNGLRVLQLHSALKQQSLFRGHTSEPLLQPVVLRLAHLHTVQGIEEAVPHSPTSMLGPPWLWE